MAARPFRTGCWVMGAVRSGRIGRAGLGRRCGAAAVVLAVVVGAAACSKSGAGSSSSGGSDSGAGSSGGSSSNAPAVTIQGDITFNDANLAKLDAALKQALAGKDLSKLDQAMVVNVAVDYWNAGKIGFNKG